MSNHTDSTTRLVSRRKVISASAAGLLSAIGLSTGVTARTNNSKGTEHAATIDIQNQRSDGEVVTTASVTMADGGFVSIHDRRRFKGEILGSIIGITESLEPGTHENVPVELFTDAATAPGPGEGQDEDGLTHTQPLLAIPHRNENGGAGDTFDGSEDGAYRDGPKQIGRFPVVNDFATVRVEPSR